MIGQNVIMKMTPVKAPKPCTESVNFKAILIASSYMIRKHGWEETIKRGRFKIIWPPKKKKKK